MATAIERDEGTFNGCFGCGSENPVGLRLTFEREGDEVVGRGVIGRQYAGYREFVHGGIVATLLDEAMGWALWQLTDQYGVTRNLQVDYRRPVGVEQNLVVRGRIDASEGRNFRLAATLEDSRGRTLATAAGDWVTVRRERASANGDGQS